MQRSAFWSVIRVIAIGIYLAIFLSSCVEAPVNTSPPVSTSATRPTSTPLLPTATLQPATSTPPLRTATVAPTKTPGSITSVPIELTHSTLPQFPWPPPKPSAIATPTLGTLGRLAREGPNIIFQLVDARIAIALGEAGYPERTYFAIPSGFAIVTRLEKTDANGYPDYSDRWASSLEPISLAEFSLIKYLEWLFSAPKGHYRVFVFMVTSEIVVQSGTAVAQSEAQTWFLEGANRLPSAMARLPYTSDHNTTVYIYEFIQTGLGADANQNIPSTITGQQHLERAGIWATLEQ